MKKYPYTLIAVACIALVATAISYRHIRTNMPIDVTPTIGTSIAAQGVTLQSQGHTLAALNTTSTKPAVIDFTLDVGGQTYRGTAPAGATVLDAMNMLASSTDFRFTSKDFPGMGAFIESINGRRNTDGYYWILYVNNTQAKEGISSIIVHHGDRIEWKYEKGY